jgi:hypothetical protein
MYGGESVHELTNLIDSIADVGSGESEVLKGANNATIFCCIRERRLVNGSAYLNSIVPKTDALTRLRYTSFVQLPKTRLKKRITAAGNGVKLWGLECFAFFSILMSKRF